MGEVNITINGRLFKLGCDDGEEEHLHVLAEHLGKHVDNLRNSIGKAGDEQLYLMAGLMVCDELWEARDVLIKTREMLKHQAEAKQRGAVEAQQAPASVLANPAEPAAMPLSGTAPARTNAPLAAPASAPANSPAGAPPTLPRSKNS